MRYAVFAIKDRAIDAFQQPWTARAEGEAIRNFTDAINQEPKMAAHADDYDLYLVGYFHDHNGELEKLAEPKQIGIGKNLKSISMTSSQPLQVR